MVRLVLKPLGRLLQPALASARAYSFGSLRHDAVASLSVAVVAVPQSMAYAVIAGVPAQYGLYAVIFQSLICALFNSQPILSVGPVNTQSLLVASTVTYAMRDLHHLSTDEVNDLYLQLVLALTIIKGVLQLIFAVARLGAMVRYVSHSVIVGFTAGAGVLIAGGQVNYLLGFGVQRDAENWPGLIGAIQQIAPNLDQTNVWSLLLGALAMTILLVSRSVSRLIPGPLLAVVATAGIVGLAGWTNEHFALVNALPSGLPQPYLPLEGLRLWEPLLGGALALSLLGLLEAYSIGTAIAAKTGQRIRANRELFSQGLANFVSGWFQCIPGSGSFSRSSLNFYAGARTCYSGLFNALFVAAIFLTASRFAQYIPMSALAAVLFVIAYRLIDWRYFLRVLKTSRADSTVCGATFAATLLLPLSYAVFVGIFLNLALYLRRASQLHIAEIVRNQAGSFEERPIADDHGEKRATFLQVEGDLFFGVADKFQDQLNRLNADGVHIVIFRLKRTLGVDATIMNVLERFVLDLHKRGGQVLLCGVKPELMRQLRAYGLVDAIGEQNVFETGYGVFTSARRALDRAQQLAGRSITLAGIDVNEREGWTYDI